MFNLSKFLVMGFVFNTSLAMAGDPREPTYPNIPPSYQVLHAQKLVANAAVNFPTYYIGRTNGYQVTAPNGTKFVVDNIAQPKCAFYGTYVTTDDNGFLGVGGGGTQVVSNVYVGEVNFTKCQ
jgi:hypothetical protein